MKAFAVLFLLSPLAALAAGMVSGVLLKPGEHLPKPMSVQIEFRTAFDPDFRKITEVLSAAPLVIYCSWKNIAVSPVELLLKERDSYHGKLDYPVGIQIRVTSENGKGLEWHDSSEYCSQFSKLLPGDIITLQPGETVTRQFELSRVIWPWKNVFPKGRSSIDVRLFDLVSKNSLTLQAI